MSGFTFSYSNQHVLAIKMYYLRDLRLAFNTSCIHLLLTASAHQIQSLLPVQMMEQFVFGTSCAAMRREYCGVSIHFSLINLM